MPKEVLAFANEKAWRKLLYYQKSGDGFKSSVLGESFFLYNNGRQNPYKELIANIEAFQKNKKNQKGQLYQCIFQARFQLLQQRWPDAFHEQECKEYSTWQKGLDAGQLYLVFATSYPNNPASMFGHTFFRFDRKNKGKRKSTKEILGYSFAFQASTDPSDNAFQYTLKGVLGGYNAFLEIKPHYIDIGVYNNSESRDIWNYPISLSAKEKSLFIKHAWELSITASFKYYFFDENCSTLVLKMLEAVRPELDFNSKDNIFVVPQETLKEMVRYNNGSKGQYRPSIKKTIINQFLDFSYQQKEKYALAKNDINHLKKIDDPYVLNALVDYWKLTNYQKHTKLSKNQSDLMYQTMLSRSLVVENIEVPKVEVGDDQGPHLGHDLSLIRLKLIDKKQTVGIRYGFHDFFDYEQGHDRSSFITFMDTEYSIIKNDENALRVTVVDILSLQDFYWNLPAFSWQAKLDYKDKDVEVLGALGLSHKGNWWQSYLLIPLQYRSKKIRTGFSIGNKVLFTEQLNLIFQWDGFVDGGYIDYSFHGELKYFFKRYCASIIFEHNNDSNDITGGASFYF